MTHTSTKATPTPTLSRSNSHPGYALRYHSPTRLVRTYFRACLRVELRRDARRNTQGGAGGGRREPPTLPLPRGRRALYTLLRRRGYDARLPEEPRHRVRRLRPDAQPVPASWGRERRSSGSVGIERREWRRARFSGAGPARITLNRGRDVARGRSRANALGAVDFQSHVFVPIDLCGDRGGGMRGSARGGGGRGPAMRRRGVATDTHQVSDRSAR